MAKKFKKKVNKKKKKMVGKNGGIPPFSGKRSCPNYVLTIIELDVWRYGLHSGHTNKFKCT